MRVVKLLPQDQAETAIVLQDKKKVDEMDMGVSTATPSLIFATTQLLNTLPIGKVIISPTVIALSFKC